MQLGQNRIESLFALLPLFSSPKRGVLRERRKERGDWGGMGERGDREERGREGGRA